MTASLDSSISSNDCIQSFYFEDIAARGCLVKLENSFVEAINGRNYAAPVSALLGESLAASCMMSTHLKFSSRLSIQARALHSSANDQPPSAPISMLLAETEMHRESEATLAQRLSVRGLVKMHEDVAVSEATGLAALLGPAQLAVTIEPHNGERYQGIVDARLPSLANSLEDYFAQSEQLATSLHLFAGQSQAAGLMLQEMPNHGGKSEANPIGFEDGRAAELWEELTVLAASITAEELFGLTADDCLYRLFHNQRIALAEPAPVAFACSCSYERTASVLASLPQSELDSILAEQGEIVMDCEFCSNRYRFDGKAVAILKR